MSELIGKNGYAVGSVEYFKNLNEKSMVGDLLREFCGSSSSTQYSKAVDGVCKRAQDAIYDIHADLKKHAAFLRYFPKSERDSLIQVVKGLEELLKLGTYTRNSTANACVSLLTLQSSETRPKSRESMQSLEKAAKLVRDGGKVRVTYATGYDLIKRAASDGVQRAAGSDLTKQTFFNAVVGNRSKEFVQDLWVLMQYQKEKHRLTGRCGKVICSKDYMNKIEAQVFGKAQSWVSDCDSYYDEVYEGLQAILLTLSADCLSLNGYLTPERADFTQTVLKELEKCGYHTKEICGIIENKRLLVFETNGDHSAMVLDLQQKLNIMGASSPDYIRIAEDGVYGNETHSAMQLFFRSLLAGSAPRLTPYDTRNWPTLSRYGIGSVNRDNLNPRQLKPHVREYFNGLPDLPDQVKLPAITRDSNRTHPSKMYSFGDMQFEAGEIKPDYIIRLDTPHSLPDERIIKYHINVEDMDLINNNKIIKFLYDHLDSSKKIEAKDGKSTHILVSDEFFHFAISDKPAAWGKGFVKAVKIADRTFLLAGYALDVVCIYRAYMEDLTENGHVTYEKTGKVVVKLVSGELFAFIGGSIGAFAGSAFGPAGIIILGAAGSMLGYAFGTILAELALEITDVIMGW